MDSIIFSVMIIQRSFITHDKMLGPKGILPHNTYGLRLWDPHENEEEDEYGRKRGGSKRTDGKNAG